MSTEQMVVESAASQQQLLRAPTNERAGHAAKFAAAACVVGTLVFLTAQLGWWALLACPAYLAGTFVTLMSARGRMQSLAAVALATASMGILVGLAKLVGIA